MSVERYKERFFKENTFQVRSEGIALRISPYVKSIISEVISKSPDSGMNISLFVDNVLKDHIREYRQEIEQMIEEGRQNINEKISGL